MYGPYVVVSGPDTTISLGTDGFPEVSGGAALAGFVAPDRIVYGDLDGDGREAAAVPLFSGGTGGAFGFLLFRESEGYPRLVTGRDGYQSGVRIERGVLTYMQPIYNSFEPNCCPSGATHTRYVLRGDDLVAVGESVEPYREAIGVTVYAFYRALSEGRYGEAYDFLSPRLQAAQPFSSWMTGYSTTRCIQAETGTPDARNSVSVTITSLDSTTTGGSIVRRFTGTWTAVWSDEGRRWLLDRADIREVSGFAATAEGRAFRCG